MSNSSRKVANTALKVVSTPARRSGRIPSPAAQQAQMNLTLVASSWATLEMKAQQDFNFLGQRWSPNPKKATASGFSVYKSLNLGRLAMGEDLLTQSPVVPDILPLLPDFTVEATLSSSNVFVLSVHSDAFYGRVVVNANRPSTSGTTRFRVAEGRVLQTLEGLTAGATVITASFLDVFPRPTVGTRLCVSLTHITPNGFRTPTRSMPAIVTRLTSPELSVK